ncbi:SGNH/GDSL hydrolase family protein [Streptomyces sp. CA-181903]|uniref:SGNH/GDSL hydrolase family protein n=1 Tax=Streptomyces sp. CA-181903 TaxID=3240055 RepID=UPI003D94EF05
MVARGPGRLPRPSSFTERPPEWGCAASFVMDTSDSSVSLLPQGWQRPLLGRIHEIAPHHGCRIGRGPRPDPRPRRHRRRPGRTGGRRRGPLLCRPGRLLLVRRRRRLLPVVQRRLQTQRQGVPGAVVGGAQTRLVRLHRLFGRPHRGRPRRAAGPLTPTTGLVSITIGGNDAGFADAMSTCVLNSDSVCLDRIATASAFIRNELPAKLDAVYSAISARSPKARVVVLGYPRFYKLDAVCVGLSEAKRRAINNAADLLDSVTAKRAADHGFAFGDVNTTFAGHELCSGSSWLHSVALPVDESYHPTAAGQSGGYLPVFSSAA